MRLYPLNHRPHSFKGYADWMYADEGLAIDSQIEALRAELEQMKVRYARYLEEESTRSDMRVLDAWIASYMEGSREAQDYLHNYGLALLTSIETRLRMAAADIYRFGDESPAASIRDVENGNALTNAAKDIAHAREHLETQVAP